MGENAINSLIQKWGWRHETIQILLLLDLPYFPLGYVVFLVLGLCFCFRYHFPSTWSQTEFIMQFRVPALSLPLWFSGTPEEVCSQKKWKYYLEVSSDLIELGQSERANSYKQISKGKSTLRKHLVCNQVDKCDNTTPVRKGLEDSFPIHVS